MNTWFFEQGVQTREDDVVFETELPLTEIAGEDLTEEKEEAYAFGEHLNVDHITKNGTLGIEEKDFKACESHFFADDEYTLDALDEYMAERSDGEERNLTEGVAIHIEDGSDFLLERGKRKAKAYAPGAKDMARDFSRFLTGELQNPQHAKNARAVTEYGKQTTHTLTARAQDGYAYAREIVVTHPEESKAFMLSYPFVFLAMMTLILLTGVHPM